MKTYIDRSTGELFAYEADGSQDTYIPRHLELLGDEELLEIRQAQDEANKPTNDQLVQAAYAERDKRLSLASIRISPLQYAADLGKADTEDERALLLWKEYLVDVNRVDRQTGWPSEISWPSEPA